jgi:heme/copper-type cytochrome/quinol oxidase subunit 2
MSEVTAAIRPRRVLRTALCVVWGVAVVFVALAVRPHAQNPDRIREVSVVGESFEFAPTRIEAHVNDIVRVTFRAADIPHSFAIDEYRIAKRAAAGQTIVFEFRVDRIGRFPVYCSLTTDDRCRRMRGELIVTP